MNDVKTLGWERNWELGIGCGSKVSRVWGFISKAQDSCRDLFVLFFFLGKKDSYRGEKFFWGKMDSI